MNNENRELLEKVTNKKLKEALDDGDVNTKNDTFEDAMKAVEKGIDLEKLDDARWEQIEKMKASEKESNRNLIVRVAEIATAVIVAPVIEVGCKKAFAKVICAFEKDGTFVTTAGRSLSGLFKFKK